MVWLPCFDCYIYLHVKFLSMHSIPSLSSSHSITLVVAKSHFTKFEKSISPDHPLTRPAFHTFSQHEGKLIYRCYSTLISFRLHFCTQVTGLLFALFGLCSLQTVSCATIPRTDVSVGPEWRNHTLNGTSHVLPREDDGEWTMVLYDNAASGGQCGGTSFSDTAGGESKSCTTTGSTTNCVNLSVNTGFLSCTWSFTKNCGQNPPANSITVNGGGSTTGQDVASVQFVSVQCT